MKKSHFEGLIAAPFTPLSDNGELNLSMISSLYQSLKKNNVKGAFICGSTGEGVSLTCEEKKLVMAKWAEQQDTELPVIALVASNSIKEVKELARFADSVGIFGLAILPPFYYKINSIELLAQYCSEIANEVPNMAVYYYHIPFLSGVNFSMFELLENISSVSNFKGIKYTDLNLEDFRKCMVYDNGKYDIMWGVDECLLGALAMGAKAGVGSTYNYMAPLYNEMISQFNLGNMEAARALQDKSIEVIGILKKYGGIGIGKSFMKEIGLDCGAFRLPIEGLELRAQFQHDLKVVGFDKYRSI